MFAQCGIHPYRAELHLEDILSKHLSPCFPRVCQTCFCFSPSISFIHLHHLLLSDNPLSQSIFLYSCCSLKVPLLYISRLRYNYILPHNYSAMYTGLCPYPLCNIKSILCPAPPLLICILLLLAFHPPASISSFFFTSNVLLSQYTSLPPPYISFPFNSVFLLLLLPFQ